MISPSTYLKSGQNPIELEEALRMRGYGFVGYGVETWLHDTSSIEGESFDNNFTDWNTPAQWNCVSFAVNNTCATTGPPAGTSTAAGLRLRITTEKQYTGKVASQGTAWRLDWLAGALTLSKGTTAGSGSFAASGRTAALLPSERLSADVYFIGGSTTLARCVITLPDGTSYDETLTLATPFTNIDLTGVVTIGNGIVGNVERFRMALSTSTIDTGIALLDMNPQSKSPSLTSWADPVSFNTWTLTDAVLVSR